MTNQIAKTSRLERVYYAVIVFMVIIWIIVAAKFSIRNQWRSATASRIIDSIRATFPNFCTDGQVLAEARADDFQTLMTDHDNIWSIRCDAWVQFSDGVHLSATFVDIDKCVTIDPIFKLSAHADEVKAMSGQKLAICP